MYCAGIAADSVRKIQTRGIMGIHDEEQAITWKLVIGTPIDCMLQR